MIEALGDKGFQDIAEIEVTGHRVLATGFGGGGRGGFGGGRGRGGDTAAPRRRRASLNMLLPQMRHFENDTWTGMEFSTANSGYPMLVRAAYGKGTFYALALPDDFADIYRLPQSVLNQIRNLLGRDLFVSLDAPDHVSLFVYDNRTFIVQNFQAKAVTTRVTCARDRPCAIFLVTRHWRHRPPSKPAVSAALEAEGAPSLPPPSAHRSMCLSRPIPSASSRSNKSASLAGQAVATRGNRRANS